MRFRVRSDASDLIYTPAVRLKLNYPADTASFKL
jgi:hypothetical protein